MNVLTYGLYDSVAKEYIRTFTAKNDDVAQRAAEYIVREPNFDKIAGRDYVINFLYAFDSETGLIVDNNIHVICSLGTALAALEAEEKENKIMEALEKAQKVENQEEKVDGNGNA